MVGLQKNCMIQGSHGGNILAVAAALGCGVTELLDMSSNLTPLGPVPGLPDVLRDKLDEIAFLPETDSETLRRAFAGKYALGVEQVLVGNGTTEFIYALPAALGLRRAVIINPTYGDYFRACSWMGMEVAGFDLQAGDDFAVDFPRLDTLLQGGELVFICNPNNPTGLVIRSEELLEFVVSHKKSHFLVDESYMPFVREMSLLHLPLPENLFVLFSASKIYGIPGLRLGFLVATAGNMALLAGRSKPWGVNRLAQVAGEYLLQQADDYVESVVSFVETERPAFAAELARLPGVEVIPGRANFILCRLTEKMNAPCLREKMLAHRIIIRDCSNFAGLDDQYFRLSLKETAENRRCLQAMEEVLGGSS